MDSSFLDAYYKTREANRNRKLSYDQLAQNQGQFDVSAQLQRAVAEEAARHALEQESQGRTGLDLTGRQITDTEASTKTNQQLIGMKGINEGTIAPAADPNDPNAIKLGGQFFVPQGQEAIANRKIANETAEAQAKFKAHMDMQNQLAGMVFPGDSPEATRKRAQFVGFGPGYFDPKTFQEGALRLLDNNTKLNDAQRFHLLNGLIQSTHSSASQDAENNARARNINLATNDKVTNDAAQALLVEATSTVDRANAGKPLDPIARHREIQKALQLGVNNKLPGYNPSVAGRANILLNSERNPTNPNDNILMQLLSGKIQFPPPTQTPQQ